jgi:hypothetical protein
VGIDRAPVDLRRPEDARWLLACVWPDTGRLERTAASIRLAQESLPRLVAGDANDVLPAVLSDLPVATVAIVVTTWAFAYLSLEQRRRFVEILEIESHRRPIAWLSAEGAGVVEAFAHESAYRHDETQSDVLGAVVIRRGDFRAQLLGYVHQHGSWIDWRAARR